MRDGTVCVHEAPFQDADSQRSGTRHVVPGWDERSRQDEEGRCVTFFFVPVAHGSEPKKGRGHFARASRRDAQTPFMKT